MNCFSVQGRKEGSTKDRALEGVQEEQPQKILNDLLED